MLCALGKPAAKMPHCTMLKQWNLLLIHSMAQTNKQLQSADSVMVNTLTVSVRIRRGCPNPSFLYRLTIISPQNTIGHFTKCHRKPLKKSCCTGYTVFSGLALPILMWAYLSNACSSIKAAYWKKQKTKLHPGFRKFWVLLLSLYDYYSYFHYMELGDHFSSKYFREHYQEYSPWCKLRQLTTHQNIVMPSQIYLQK